MSLQTVIFDGFQIERTVAASPAEAFHAYTDRAAKAVWFDGGDAWEIFERSLDFRPGGTEVSVSRAAGGGDRYGYFARFHDIAPNERIVMSYDMEMNGERLSTSLVVVEFQAAGAGTRVVYSEAAVFAKGKDTVESRKDGCAWLLDQLAKYVEGAKVGA